MNVLIVSGSRVSLTPEQVTKVRNELIPLEFAMLIHGACGCDGVFDENKLTGVDGLCHRYAVGRCGVCIVPFPAKWTAFDQMGQMRAAGPRRNEDMAVFGLTLKDYGHDVQYRAFPAPGSRGTQDFIRQARRYGIGGEVVSI
jgi:hypothetical protein